MRVGYLVSKYPAPSHRFIRREVLALRAHGVDIETFSVRRPSADECLSEDDRLACKETIYVLPANLLTVCRAHLVAVTTHLFRYFSTLRAALRHRVPGVAAFAWGVFYFGEAIVLADELQRRKIDHLHNHFANAGANVGLLAAHFLRIPWSFTAHGISETDYPAGVILPMKVCAADFVACVSYFGRAQAMRLVPHEHWEKIFINRCALDLATLPARSTETREHLRIICVARLSAEKGHFGLLEAFKSVRDRGDKAHLVLIGDGPERGRIEDMVRELDLTDCVKLLGVASEQDTLAEIAASDVMVLASLIEGLPVALMEAMAFELPVIAPQIAGIPELVNDGQEGLLFTPGKWSELADVLHAVVSDAQLRQRLGKAGRAKILAEFEISKAVAPLAKRFGVECGKLKPTKFIG